MKLIAELFYIHTTTQTAFRPVKVLLDLLGSEFGADLLECQEVVDATFLLYGQIELGTKPCDNRLHFGVGERLADAVLLPQRKRYEAVNHFTSRVLPPRWIILAWILIYVGVVQYKHHRYEAGATLRESISTLGL